MAGEEALTEHFESFVCPITGDVMEDPVVTIGKQLWA
jgi:hypothetical protein